MKKGSHHTKKSRVRISNSKIGKVLSVKHHRVLRIFLSQMKPTQNHPWRKSFIIREWQENNKITRRKKIHYEASEEDKGRYMNYVKTKQK